MKRLVIVGEFDSDNVGDQLIGDGQKKLFSEEGWDVVMFALEPAGRLGSVSRVPRRTTWGRSLHRRLYRESIWYRHVIEVMLFFKDRRRYLRRAEEIVAGADLVMIGGGQLFSDGTLRMMKRLLDLATLANLHGVPVVAFGTGISKPRTFISSVLLRSVLRRITLKSWFRDDRSINIARLYAPNRVFANRAVPDCAISAVASFENSVDTSSYSSLVGLAPMSTSSLGLPSTDLTGSDAWWAETVSQVYDRGLRPVLFCTGTVADEQRCLQVQSLCASLGLRVDVQPRPHDSKELLSAMARMGFMLGQRLHSSISYYSLGHVPASLIWDHKVVEFYRMIGCQARVIDPALTSPKAAIEMLVRKDIPQLEPRQLEILSKAMARECLDSALSVSSDG